MKNVNAPPHTHSAARSATSACIFSAFILLSLSAHAETRAQEDASTRRQVAPTVAPSANASQRSRREPAGESEPDLSITATVRARELTFEVVPNSSVEFPGRPRRETVWEAERENLPPQVRPGETYRDIGIRLRITSVFADIDRIVAEALGEVPLTDDSPQRDAENPARVPSIPPAAATPTPRGESNTTPTRSPGRTPRR